MLQKKVLVIDTVAMHMNGISTAIFNYYKLCRTNVEMSFVINNDVHNYYSKEFLEDKNEFYILERTRFFNYLHNLKRIIKKNKYDIVHIHGNSATMLLETMVAKVCKVKKIIVHCHNSECGHKVLHKLLSPVFKKTYHKALACSNLAGTWIFGENNYEVLYNGIDVSKFKFNDGIRNEIRDEYEINNRFVIGHVGLFNEQKNHEKLINVFHEVVKQKKNSVLVCVSGDKDVPDVLAKQIKALDLEEKVIILKECNNVNEILCALDVFVFPSKWEGLGIALIEAQASGLPCVISNTIPKDVDLTETVVRKDLDYCDKDWADEILKLELLSEKQRYAMNKKIEDSNYNISHCKEKLLGIYMS